ncbi:MAG: tyrosine--tRNA ligase, partial [Elusimicrobia bacterium]|nr:tyrosine--tRNA ligase [Elusimicrobiota bacterium]
MEIEKQLHILQRGAVELVSPEELKQKIQNKKTLRVKLGVDPTSPELHLGHTVPLTKLRAFQDLGHHAVLIIGDFTAQVGDPSGQDKTRPVLSYEEIQHNAQTYQTQAFKVLDPSKTEVRFNSEWLAPIFQIQKAIPRGSVLQTFLTRYSVFRLLEREDFAKRRKAEQPLTIAEILYPLLQGYDSVAVKADVELGGNDQIFNLLMGRQVQKDFGQETQVALTLPLLIGTDGTKKMS